MLERAVFFIEQIAPGLYVFCAAGLVWAMWRYYRARQALAGAQFELEKELERYRASSALTAVFALVEIGLFITAIAYAVAPTLRAQPISVAISAPEVEETPLVTGVPGGLANIPGPGTPGSVLMESVPIPGLEDQLNLGPLATPTLTPTPVGTIVTDVPPSIGCDTPDARLTIPANGMVVFEATNVIGSANTTDFAFYRFELKGPSTNNAWAKLSEYTVPVTDGELGQIVPALLTPGEHLFRLNVFDIHNAVRASCTITIIISPPIPTATPIRE